jgi:acyl-CoA oxidase
MDVATGEEARRQNEAAEYYRTLRASADAPVPEKSLKRKPSRR